MMMPRSLSLHRARRANQATASRLNFAAAVCLGACVLLPGCSSIEKAPPQPVASRADRGFTLNVPQVMRGTVNSEALLFGYEPVIVRGYGLVVGLNGTGSRDLPPNVRAHMITEMSRRGIGSASKGAGDLSPEQMLNSPDTSVVIVEARIPPGASKGSLFDVRVYADPRTGTTSLEGGRLYTADLRPVGQGERLPPTGSKQASIIAQAKGPVFINPFAEPGSTKLDNIDRTTGRILNGGIVTVSMPMKLGLANPSHVRAEILQNAINSRFPQERGQQAPTARGESDESIEITVPPSYTNREGEFVELLKHTTISQAAIEQAAMSVRRSVEANPAEAVAAAWRWQAMGPRALPIIVDLYDYPEELPRGAALRAGAYLDDARVIPHLIDMAQSASTDSRIEAIHLLGEMRMNPRIDVALREILNDKNIEVRLSAYEALEKRHDPMIQRIVVGRTFFVDIVESDSPMVYITQSGDPRIVLFGNDLDIQTPATLVAWSNRLMIKADSGDSKVEVYYRDENALEGSKTLVERRLPEFIRFLGQETSPEHPEQGLGLTYAQTVGALHQIWRQGLIQADFSAEQDRILAAILDEERKMDIERRPEFTADASGDDASAVTNPSVNLSDLQRVTPTVPRPGSATP